MIKSSLKNFYKKKILIIITIVITSSIILSSLSSFFIQKRSLPILTVNQEKIYPEVLKLIYKIIKKKQNKTIKEIFLKIISKEEYKKYIFQQIIIDVINESLLKEYIKDINFYISKKNIKKIIYSSKNFKKKKKINYKKYLKFINYIQYTHNEYINSLQKKISVKYLIKLLSKSIILLKKEIHNKLKKIIERKNIQVIHFNTKLNKLEKKKNKSKIKKYFLLNKKKFYYPESCIIKIIHLKKKKK
ncbi:SurA N-terminal domain-containing protein [Buchnera aphidicola]|uniref:SurA N-terminal domain-containing protein n=1 Tax=Buchnera aphidicola TaxID=9 RepID=UPI0002E777CA|nr:SurA N-terminal domain-containing protein [Buchnera aphidicola]